MNTKDVVKKYIKKKVHSSIKVFLLNNPVLILVLIVIFVSVIAIGSVTADIGDMGDNTIESSLSSNANKDIIKDLQDYLDNHINIGIPDSMKYDSTVQSDGSTVQVPSDFHSNNDLVNYSLKFLGTPYLWGGTTPKGFDCSGLVQYVYAHFKINIPRTSQAQFNVGKSIGKSNLKPGDLVFFEGVPPGHVGMYIGDGKYIQAPKTGDVVKISILNARNDFVGARRIVDKFPSSNSNEDTNSSNSSSDSTDDTDMDTSADSDSGYSDAYNIIRKFYITTGNVFGYMKYMEMSLGVPPQNFFDKDAVQTDEDMDNKDSKDDKDDTDDKKPNIISQEIIKKKIENNAHKIANKFKPDFKITNMESTDVVTSKKDISIGGINLGSKTVTDTNKSKVAEVTHISSIYGEIDLIYKQETSTFSDADGTHTVTKPVYQGYKLQGKLFEKLRNIIQKDFPDEKDVDDAIYFIIKSGFNFDDKQQNGDWINGSLSDITLDSLLADIGGNDTDGVSAGIIPTFFQWDSKWASYPYANSTMDKLGSAPTSLAMVVSGLEGKLGSYDKNKNGILEPNEAADYLKAAGVVKDTDANSAFSSAASAFGLTMKHFSKSQYNDIVAELKAGHPVIANVHGNESISYGSPGSTFTQGNHYIVLVDIDNNKKVTVHDPYDKNKQNDRTWDLSTIIATESSDFYSFNNPSIVYKTGVATAYTGDNIGPNGGTIAAWNEMNMINKNLGNHLIAADKSIPFGTLVIVKVPENKRYWKMANGQKVDANGAYVVVDRGGAINGTHIDIYFGSGSYYNTSSGGGIANQFGTVNIKLRVTKNKLSFSDANKH
ncbi:NlpC/P60 family protein [Clostridium tyrobutyricum]|jgi:cell wall-associated NlpC family hydrolase/3D (Asp-Asp-Asp) domain-containing protein|uniref:NlpC/P60 family protein n=1 Tax=Clostridium tyrobutyricum TaxID=1519 RepID=UPI0011C9244F